MARPTYEPSKTDRATVEAMAAAGIKHDTIARCIGDAGIDEKTLRKHFRRELDTSADKSNALVATQVFRAAQRGEAWACCFWLKCRAGWKERSVLEVEKEGKYTLEELLTTYRTLSNQEGSGEPR